jgi:Rrf2 family transcriptional regulator, nitric oxide-sensitive transcriptional repressor
MRLTNYTDYALRILMYAAARPERLITIEEVASYHRISRAHLMKVVHQLAGAGILRATRGRSGGFTVARDPAAIRVGDIVRLTEPQRPIVECLASGDLCVLTSSCRLRRLFAGAFVRFMTELDQCSIADLVNSPQGQSGFALETTTP